jgi:hypothetical protein
MRKFLALVAVLSLAGCISDEVTSQYATLAEARADRLFVRGWLPDILPPSSHDIRTSNNLDRNTSEGEFYFNQEHAGTFYGQLHRGSPTPGGSEQWQQLLAERAQEGLDPWWYMQGGHTWVFFCSTPAGKCRYMLW